MKASALAIAQSTNGTSTGVAFHFMRLSELKGLSLYQGAPEIIL